MKKKASNVKRNFNKANLNATTLPLSISIYLKNSSASFFISYRKIVSKTLFTAILACFFCKISAQTADSSANKTTEIRAFWKDPKPTIAATRLEKTPKIDGQPDDICWQNLPEAGDFVQHRPVPYTRASQKTTVKIGYTDEALYFLVYLYDTEPNSIKRELGQRDNLDIATDYINIALDTYNDDQNAFRFGVTAAGVQFDSRVSNGGNADLNWDAVWESAVSMQKDGWVAEYKVPLSAIRFAAKDVQTWGFHATRGINRLAEESTWSGIDPKIDGIVIQYGSLTNLENIKPPLRLQFSPYLAAVTQRTPSFSGGGAFLKYQNQNQLTGGMDVKIGLNQSFTLDMTLIPNFGQVQSDNQILNLGPFEVQFNENRPFFTEGAEIFNKGNLFYSRRIGGTPDGFWNVKTNENEIIRQNPSETQLYNATKLSGRTNKNLGIGLLNAVTAPMFATIEDTITKNIRLENTAVLTNYNVFSLSQALKNNGEISFVNALTLRDATARDANVSALFSRFRDKKNRYQLSLAGRMSQIFEEKTPIKRGYTAVIEFQKVSGNWTWGLATETQTDQWDPNDLGIFNGNNFINGVGWVQYQQVKPNKLFQQSQVWLNYNHNWQFSSRRFMDFALNWGFWGQFKNQWWVNWWSFLQPITTYDFFESRTGAVINVPALYNSGFNVGSDERKKLAFRLFMGIRTQDLPDFRTFRCQFGPRFRVNNRLSFEHQIYFDKRFNEVGFATRNGSDVTLGRRDRSTIENIFFTNLKFNAKANLTFRARHYWSKVAYNQYLKLQEDGNWSPRDWSRNENRNTNIFNIDMIYTWQFAPGSFMNLIWKNSIFSNENNYDAGGSDDYLDNVSKTMNTPKTNALTLKVIYFLDYLDVKKHLKKG